MRLYVLFQGILKLFLCAGLSSSLTISEPKTRVIETKLGPVRGVVKRAVNGKLVDTFLGIPFAEPPLGDLRFKRPQPAIPWDGIFEATTLSFDCQQVKVPNIKILQKFGFTRPYTEDCLKLNIWVPNISKKKENIPVIFFIPPGAFAAGGARAPLLQGFTLASEENVIVVTFNYRVASFGFLFLDDEEAPGNMGLLDQVMALQWVKDNIAKFGGDPERITLMGESAGGTSVLYHHLSPLSRDLFQRSIVESGAPSYTYGFSENKVQLERAIELGKNLECNTKNITELVHCLRKADAEDITNSEPRPEGNEGDIIIFTPIMDGYFITDTPFELLKNKDFKKSELLIGTNRDEGSLFLMLFNSFVFNPFRLDPPITVDEIFNSFKGKIEFSKAGKELLENLYFDPEYSLSTNVTGAIRLVTDIVFSCPVTEWAMQMTEVKKTVYRYFYTHRPVKFLSAENLRWMGAFHGAELFFVFGDPIVNPEEYTEDEIHFSRQTMRYWMNFARTGNPNISPDGAKLEIPLWPKFSNDKQEYLVLAPNSTVVGTYFRHKSCRFVTKTMPRLVVSDWHRKEKSCF